MTDFLCVYLYRAYPLSFPAKSMATDDNSALKKSIVALYRLYDQVRPKPE